MAQDIGKGKFIALEGVDGSGISTQTQLLKFWLEENAQTYGKTYFTKEPTDGPVGGLIRLVLSKRLKVLDEKIMALLFAADRLDHLYCSGQAEQKSGIVEMLSNSINVVTDRYYLSTFAYQSLTVDLPWIREINRYSLKPDLTILLYVPVTDSVQRRNQSRFHNELYEQEDFLNRVSQNYLAIAKTLQEEGENIVIINGAQKKDDVFTQIKNAVVKILSS